MWIDRNITPGEDWRADIAHAIERSFAVVFVVSPFSVQSKYCKEVRGFGVEFAPVLVLLSCGVAVVASL